MRAAERAATVGREVYEYVLQIDYDQARPGLAVACCARQMPGAAGHAAGRLGASPRAVGRGPAAGVLRAQRPGAGRES